MRTSAHIFSPRPKTVQHLIPLSLFRRKKRCNVGARPCTTQRKPRKAKPRARKAKGGKPPKTENKTTGPRTQRGRATPPMAKDQGISGTAGRPTILSFKEYILPVACARALAHRPFNFQWMSQRILFKTLIYCFLMTQLSRFEMAGAPAYHTIGWDL